MPKKKKSGHSPGRVSAQAGECEGRGHAGHAGHAAVTWGAPRDPQRSNSTLHTSHQPSFQSKDDIVRSMQEMFSHLDPVVIYIVLSEADFKVDNAMDALLELSDAAEGKTTSAPPLSGFEMAAALLEPQQHQNKTETSIRNLDDLTVSETVETQQKFNQETTRLTEELDSLIDQELENLTSTQNYTGFKPPLSSVSLSSLPPPSQSIPLSSLPDHQVLSEFKQLDMESGSKFGSSSGHSSASTSRLGGGGASPVNELSFKGASCAQKKDVPVDFSHLTEDSVSRPSAFKAYRRPDAQLFEGLHNPAMSWNIQAAEFQPSTEGPVFITPVMQAPNPWTAHPFTAAQWLASKPVSQAPLKPSATVPKSWTLPPRSRLKLEGQVLVLLRGAPGSGKTTLASAMLEHNPGGIVLSTDEYFTQNGTYRYEPDLLGEAHAWNHRRAKEAFEKGYAPIIIDNTNMQCWEMKPYVALALQHRYKVLFREPDTWWKTKPRELEKRTKHGVTREKIRRMIEHQDRYVSVQNIMASQGKPTAVFGVEMDQFQTEPTQQPVSVGLSRPDLVGDSGFGKPGGHLSSSLPDVSSVGQKCSYNSRLGAAEGDIGSHSSKESVSSLENVAESVVSAESELLDGADLDWELDSCLPLAGSSDYHLNEEPDLLEEKVLEQPVLFSQTIGQRVKREREHNRSGDDADVSQSLNFELSDSSVRKTSQEDSAKESNQVMLKPELLNFVGDWPSESLAQRGQRSQKVDTQTSKHPNEETAGLVEDCLKLLDLKRDKEGPTDSYSISIEEQNSDLDTEVQMVLPDCVLEWKSEQSTHPEENNPKPQSPAKELEVDHAEDFKSSTTEAGADMQNTTNGGTDAETVDSEAKDKLSPNPYLTLSSGGEVDPNAEVSQEKRKGLSRRGGKSCRLALTFTNQSPTSACLHAGSPVSSPQLPDLMPSPQQEPLLTSLLCTSAQTDPQDFSVLWKINQLKCPEPESDSSMSGLVILEGNPLRFVPKTNEETSSGQQNVPYRVRHEKGSQVEESDLRELPLKQHSLEILCRHFKHVPLETLEDLYEKCHQDVDWVTNLLLDSGEQLYRDDDDDDDDGDEIAGDDLGPPVSENVDLDLVSQNLPKQKMDAMMEQVSSDVTAYIKKVPSASDDFSSTVSSDCGESEDSVGLDQSELGQAMEDSDQEKHLEHKLEELAQGGNDELLGCMLRHSNVPHPDQPERESETETETPQAPLQELKSVPQGENSDQFFEDGLEERTEEEITQEKEDREIKEEVDAVTQLLLAQLEDIENKKMAESKERDKERRGKNGPMDIQTLELKLPTELALQLTELFGPVGISPGEFSPEDCSVLIDLNVAKLLHQKWKESIQERHRQAALSYHLLQESSVHWGESQPAAAGQMDSAAQFLIGADGYSALGSQESFPFMDHWNVSRPPVSLRNIMNEEQVMQDSLEKSRLSRCDLEKKDAAAILKENQLFSLFPTIDRHFLRDIFRDQNYSLEQTKQFLYTLLDDGPVKNVVAPEAGLERNEVHRAPSKERKRKQKNEELDVKHYQDTEDPEYEDFRTEAILQRQRQHESFAKAAEAFRQGRKDVASFYAQQGHLHGQKMKEANYRAAMQIFERVNATLLPQNVLDLHGLHVDEALLHLQQVLADKTSEWQQGLCRPQLSVITGRGNHSQGGVARIRPAVLDYLKNQHYRYSEPKPGLILVTLH